MKELTEAQVWEATTALREAMIRKAEAENEITQATLPLLANPSLVTRDDVQRLIKDARE